MDWLHSIDIAVFRFINGTLQNSFFDRVMPFFSSNAFFYPILGILAGWLIWKCGPRGRLFVFFALLVVAIGDGVICKNLKQSIGRERPFWVLENVHMPSGIGKSHSGSMPSSHAANWFSAVTVAFLYYRRSWRFMLPLAGVVSFSRVYNGVHFPTDILVAAFLGIGYALAIVFGVHLGWQQVGRRLFPLWYGQLPSLLKPECSRKEAAEDDEKNPREQQWLNVGYALLVILFFARLGYLAGAKIELSEDEAYQWLWSKHLALSYYSKPPMIAYLQWIGTSIWGDTELGVRFFAPVLATILGFLVLRFVSRYASARTAVIALLILTCTPLLAVGATLMTIDPPLVFFWVAAMFAGWRAMQPEGTTRDWMWAGLWLGLSFLSKYAALYQLACWALFFALYKPARVHLRRPGPYLALLFVGLSVIPVVVWNAQHDWITLEHVASNAGLKRKWEPTTNFFFDFIYAQLALLNPVFLVAMVWAMCAFWRNDSQRKKPLFLFLFSMGAPVWIGYFLFTAWKRVFPNWIAPSVVPLFLLMIFYWRERWPAYRRFATPALVFGCVLGAFAIVVLHDTNLIGKLAHQTLPAEKDPLRRVRAWENTAQLIGEERKKLAAEGKPAFIIGAHYGITGEISFYLPEARETVDKRTPLVYVISTKHPQNQLFFWPEYKYREHRRGENALFVQELRLGEAPASHAPAELTEQFENVEDWGIREIKYRDGRVFRVIQLFACRSVK